MKHFFFVEMPVGIVGGKMVGTVWYLLYKVGTAMVSFWEMPGDTFFVKMLQ